MKDSEYRYLKYVEHHLKEIETVWGRHLESDEALRKLFEAIATDEEKDLFLRIGTFYKYLIVEGSFHFPKKELNVGMSYVDETYKYVAIFSLIEALETRPDYQDFYKWIQAKKNTAIPLNKKPMSVLDQMYKDYKAHYGSTQAAVKFFERLDRVDQTMIENKLKVHGTDSSLKKLAQFLYDMRSKFVHEAHFILSFGPITTAGIHNKSFISSKLTMGDLRMLFEHGFLKRFGWNGITQQSGGEGPE